MIHYSCIGATGYVCGEVLRMMVNHHEGELVNVLDTYGVGDAISTHHPALRGFYDQVIMDLTEENVRETAKKSDVIMIQVPSATWPSGRRSCLLRTAPSSISALTSASAMSTSGRSGTARSTPTQDDPRRCLLHP